MDLFILLKYHRISKFADYIYFFSSQATKLLNKRLFSIIYKAEQNKNCPPPLAKNNMTYSFVLRFFSLLQSTTLAWGVGRGVQGCATGQIMIFILFALNI